MSVKTWQIFYREIDQNGVVTFRATQPMKVLFKEDQARRKFESLKKNASINQAYNLVTVSPTGEIVAMEFWSSIKAIQGEDTACDTSSKNGSI